MKGPFLCWPLGLQLPSSKTGQGLELHSHSPEDADVSQARWTLSQFFIPLPPRTALWGGAAAQ